MSTRGYIKIILILISTLFLFGCASQKRGEKNNKVTITFMNAEAARAQIAIMKKIVKGFEALNPGIKVRLEYGVRRQKILISMAGGEPPDVFMWWGGMYDLQKRGVLLPLNALIRKYHVDMSRYFKNIVNYYTYNGKLYAFPLQLKTVALVYNKNIFDQAGLPYPDKTWTWNDYLRVATSLTKSLNKNNKGRRDQFGTVMPSSLYWIMLNGGGLIDPETRKCILDSPQTREALRFLIKLNKEAVPTPAERSAFSGQAGTQGFMTGRIAMKIAWAWELASYSTIKNFQWEVAPVPKPPQRKRTYIFDDAGLCLSSQSKHPEAAFRFIKYYTGIKGMKLFGKARNGIPALKEAAYTTFIEPPPYHLKDYLKAAEKANIPWNPRIGRWDEIEQPFGREMTLVFLGKEDLNTAIRKIVSETNRLLSENK